MSEPKIPSRTDVAPDTNAVLVHNDGITSFRYGKTSPSADPQWIETGRYDHEDIRGLSLGDDGLEPPVLGEFSVSVEIDAPVDRVFDYVADIHTHPEYADFVERVDVVSGTERGEDVVFEQVHRGSDETIKTEFVSYQPNEHAGWVTHKSAGDLRINYWFEPTESGTAVYHAGIQRLADDSPQSFNAALDTLWERYENNVVEMGNLKSILKGGK